MFAIVRCICVKVCCACCLFASCLIAIPSAISGENGSSAIDEVAYLHWSGGAEATFLDPQFGRVGEPTADTVLSTVQPGWEAAPRIWLGAETENGWGVRSRFWQLDAERQGSPVLDPTSLQTIDPDQKLQMYEIDLELTRRFELQEWRLLGSVGGRFASLERRVGVNIVDPLGPSSLALDFGNETSAGGLTFALEASRPLGFGGWEVFGALRASPLWGFTNFSTSLAQTSGGGTFSVSEASRAASDLVIWEAQVGLQCSKELASRQGTVFARCAFEYQSWNWNSGGGDSSFLNFTLSPSVDLYGVSFAVGISR